MIEAEIKARLRDPDAVRAALDAQAAWEIATYRDTYFDTPAGELDRDGRELRLRTIETAGGVRHLLTYKGPAVDTDTGSKPETETAVGSADAAAAIVGQLGYVPTVQLTKECVNYRLDHAGREFLASVVQVPELAGTFLEVETQAGEEDLAAALNAVREVLDSLGVPAVDITTELYTDAVRAAGPPST